MRGFRGVLRDREFVALTLVAGLAFGAAFAYISAAPFVMHEEYGLDDQRFGLVFGLGALALVVATQFNTLLLRRFTPVHIMAVAAIGAAVASVALGVIPTLVPGALAGFLIPLVFVLAGIALVMPNAAAVALSRHGEMAGTAASVLGAIRFVLGSAAAPVVGLFGNDATATAIVMTGSLVATSVLVLKIARRSRDARSRAVAGLRRPADAVVSLADPVAQHPTRR